MTIRRKEEKLSFIFVEADREMKTKPVLDQRMPPVPVGTSVLPFIRALPRLRCSVFPLPSRPVIRPRFLAVLLFFDVVIAFHGAQPVVVGVSRTSLSEGRL